MKTFKYALTIMLLSFSTWPIVSKAESDVYRMDVGEEDTFQVPYSVTSTDISTYYWSNNSPSAVEIVSSSFSSITVRVLAYQYSRALLQLDYYRLSDGRRETYDLYIDIRKPDITLSVSPSGGTVKKGQYVEITCNKYDADIYYTLNGSTPYVGGQKYDKWNGIVINESCTLKAIASWGGVESDIVTANYTVESDPDPNPNPDPDPTPDPDPSTSIEPTSITVSPSSKTIKAGDSFTMNYTLSPSNATTSVTWSSENYGIASVSSSGTVTGEKAGTTYIYATTSNGKTDFCKVTVETDAPIPSGIEINATNFPDANFRNYLLEQDYGKDGVITGEEINKIKEFYVGDKEINSLIGIEYFVALEGLHCQRNKLTSLDVSKCTMLKYLDCSDNTIITLDLSNNNALENLYCYENELTSLDVSNNTALTTLACRQMQLKELDVSKNTNLTELLCESNEISTLDLSKNPKLEELSCMLNKITSLVLSNNTNLKNLFCSNNQLTSLDLSRNINLNFVACDYNPLSSINISNNTKLTYLSIACCSLSSLDVSNNIYLEKLYCNSNQLTSLDVSSNIALKAIDCSRNKIKGIEMDNLISSLPMNYTGTDYEFHVIVDEYDENVCTTTQVATVKARGWKPCFYDFNVANWLEYEGSDPSSINGILVDKDNIAPIFDLSGRRLDNPRKGINIIGGKKVVVK